MKLATPVWMLVCPLIIMIISIYGCIPYYIGGIICGLVFIVAQKWNIAGYTTLCASICVCTIAGLRLYTILDRYAYAQSIAMNTIHTRACVRDVDPQLPYHRTRMATIDIPLQSDYVMTYKIRIPHDWDITTQDDIYIRNFTLPQITNTGFMWHLLREQIAGYVHKTPYISILHRPRWSVHRAISEARNAFLSHLYAHLSQEHADMVSHIFLGYKVASRNIKDMFAAWGASHVLARSGLHLAVFTSCCLAALRCLPCYYLIHEILVCVLTLIYAALSWMSVSFLRALCMLCGYYACRALYMRYHAHHWVVLSGVVILCYNPFHLFFLDFQLSFILTWALCWVFTHIVRPSNH